MIQVFKKYYLFVFSVLFLAACKWAEKVEKISVETFFKDAEKSVFSVSPDGKSIAYLKPYNGKLNIFVECLSGDSVTRLTSESDVSIQKYFWAGNNHILYVIDKGQAKNFRLYSVTKDGKKNVEINIKSTTKIEFIDTYKYSKNNILVALNERNPKVFDVYNIDLETGKMRLVEKNPGNIIRWIANDDNEIRLAIGTDGDKQTVYYRASNSGKFTAIQSNEIFDTFQPVGFTTEDDHIYVLSNLNRDKLALVEFDCSAGKEIKVLYENPHGDITDVMYFKTLNKMVYVNTEIEKREVHFLDERLTGIYYKIKKKVQEKKYKVVSTDVEEENFVLRSFNDKSPGAYYIYNVKSDSLKKLADINPEIKETNMAEQKPVSYLNRDGIKIQGFLTIPKGKIPLKLPVVVIPHGGPYTKSTWGYSEEVQFLANRGYAVFQMNYRGSTGFGKAFKNAGNKQWITTIHNDITDGVKWLIDEKIADKEKIAIYGHGFGGLAALNQLIYNPELYKCAISNSGFNNLFTYIKGLPLYYKPQEKMISELIGDPERDVEYLRSSSPIFHSTRIKKPLLIVQGGKDPKVNVSETNQFVKELRKRKVDVNYLLNENEGYYFSDVNNKIEFYKALESFLAVNLGQK